MKRLFSLFLFIITMNVSGQKIIHNQPVEMKNVRTDWVESDSTMVQDGTGAIKLRPTSTIIDSVNILNWKHSTTNSKYLIKVDGGHYFHNYSGNTTYANQQYWANMFIGNDAGNFTSTGSGSGLDSSLGNIGLGSNTLMGLTTGSWNIALGTENLALLTTGYNNVAIGAGGTMYYATTATRNTSVGAASMQNNVSGSRNTAIGMNSLFSILTDGNTAIGDNSGIKTIGAVALTSAVNSVFLGAETRSFDNAQSNEIVIGHSAYGKGSNTAVIGNASITKISAGADYTAVDPEDLVTKGYADATYTGGGGTLSNIVEDLSPQLGAPLDAQGHSITFNSLSSASIGSGPLGGADTANLFFFQHNAVIRSFDAGSTNLGQVEFSYDDTSGYELLFNDLTNSQNAKMIYFGLGDGFIFQDADIVSFDDAEIQDTRLQTATETVTQALIDSDMSRTIFSDAAGAITYTIPDTLTQDEGAHFTIIAEGTGTVTVTTSGTATINGSTSFDIVVTGVTANKILAVQFIQKGNNTDDWVCIGAY